ncbi:ABC transporter substrate-binding protein [Endozoicomonadaceae bacterium StTr2]
MSYLFRLIFFSLIITILSASYLFFSEKPEQSDQVSSGSLDSRSLKVAAVPLIGSSPLYIALEKGYFEQEGLNVSFISFQAAQHVAVAVASGEADIGVTGLTAGFYNLAADGSLKIIGGQSREYQGWPGSMLVASKQASEDSLSTVEGLPGHSFAITQMGSTFHYMLGQLADSRGFELEQVKLSPLHTLPNVIASIKSGQVDAAILPPQIASKLTEAGLAQPIARISDIFSWQLGAIFSNSQLFENKPDLLRRFLRAWTRAAREYNAAFGPDRQEVTPETVALSELISRAVKPEMSPELIRQNAVYIHPEAGLDIENIHRQLRWYQKAGLVKTDIDSSQFIATDLLDQIPGSAD